MVMNLLDDDRPPTKIMVKLGNQSNRKMVAKDKACNISLSWRILEGKNIFLEHLFTTKLGGRNLFGRFLLCYIILHPEEPLSSWELEGALLMPLLPVR